MNFFTKVKNSVVRAKAAVMTTVAAGAAAVAATPAHAALDLTGVTVDTGDYILIATFLITALVAFWGIKKGLALLGR